MCKNYTVAVIGNEATVLGRQLQGFVSYWEIWFNSFIAYFLLHRG